MDQLSEGVAWSEARYNHVLVGVDGSVATDLMLRWAVSRALADRSRLTLVTVVAPPLWTVSFIGQSVEAVTAHNEQLARAHLNAVVRRMPELLSVTSIVCRGKAAEQLLKLSRQLVVDLVCLGLRSGLQTPARWRGSVAFEVMRRSEIPVVVPLSSSVDPVVSNTPSGHR
jgi:nucleotide-binding universal stress UspA family protein